jgi:hypothetical protein
MKPDLTLLVISVVIFSIGGFYITKDAYKPGSDDYRGKILGPGFILLAIAAFYKLLEAYFGW